MKIVVVGTGHVGLVTAATLAHLGHEVAAVDTDVSKIERLRSGVAPFFEPGLDELVARVREQERLDLATSVADVVPGADAAFICVGTPPPSKPRAAR